MDLDLGSLNPTRQRFPRPMKSICKWNKNHGIHETNTLNCSHKTMPLVCGIVEIKVENKIKTHNPNYEHIQCDLCCAMIISKHNIILIAFSCLIINIWIAYQTSRPSTSNQSCCDCHDLCNLLPIWKENIMEGGTLNHVPAHIKIEN